MYDVESIQQMFQNYGGITMFLPAFWVCVIYVFCYGKESGRKRMLAVFLLSILFVFNDLSMKLVGKITGEGMYYRFIWALPILPLIAWAGTKVVMEREKRWEKAVVFGLLFCLFWGGKSSFITEGSIRIPENPYNLSGDVIQVCDIIAEDKDKERPVVIFDYGCQLEARLYDPSLVWGISRRAYQFHNDAEGYEHAGKYKTEKALIHAANFGVKSEPERLAKALKKKKVDYIVTLTAYEMDDYLEGAGYKLKARSEMRSVYVRTE